MWFRNALREPRFRSPVAAIAGRIRLEVIDDGPGFSLGAITPEHGLGNLVARLELLYGGAGRLEVARENEKTVVRTDLSGMI